MRKMAIAAPGPKPNTTKPAPGHKIYPYLLQDDDRPAAADITYRPIGRGFFYFAAIIDSASRTVLAWRLSNTRDVSFCVAALEALATYGTSEISARCEGIVATTPIRAANHQCGLQRRAGGRRGSRSPWMAAVQSSRANPMTAPE
jgi:putative transposase